MFYEAQIIGSEEDDNDEDSDDEDEDNKEDEDENERCERERATGTERTENGNRGGICTTTNPHYIEPSVRKEILSAGRLP